MNNQVKGREVAGSTGTETRACHILVTFKNIRVKGLFDI